MILRGLIAVVALLCAFVFMMVMATNADARARGRKCDGFQACRCGTTAARKAGLPYIYKGINLKQARSWLAFERASPRSGVVCYVRRGGPTGHVFTLVALNNGADATVFDDAGTYERNIDGATCVEPGVLR